MIEVNYHFFAVNLNASNWTIGMKRFINLSKVEGIASRQAHADMPDGTFERELGKEGFFGPSALIHHKNPPTGWVEWDGPLKPSAFDLNKIPKSQSCSWTINNILHNDRCRISWGTSTGRMDHLVRNGDGDELLFIHNGSGLLYSDYGTLDIEQGDYILVPRGTMWRTEFTGAAEVLMIEATNSSFGLPEKGLVGNHAFFDPAMLDTPKLDKRFLNQQTQNGEVDKWKVLIKRKNVISTVTYPYNPLDAIGWHGDLMPVKINIRHFRPIMSHRYHLPPSAHTTFVAERFVVCTFCPRPFEQDPGALKVPFFHNNDDYDEVLFYHAGDFFSRDNIESGMMTFHPSGFTHGPHPKALKNMLKAPKPATDEYAIMVDSRDALEISSLPQGVENIDYVNSWKGHSEAMP